MNGYQKQLLILNIKNRTHANVFFYVRAHCVCVYQIISMLLYFVIKKRERDFIKMYKAIVNAYLKNVVLSSNENVRIMFVNFVFFSILLPSVWHTQYA